MRSEGSDFGELSGGSLFLGQALLGYSVNCGPWTCQVFRRVDRYVCAIFILFLVEYNHL